MADDRVAVHVLARAGDLFQASGADTAHALRHVREASSRLGIDSDVMITMENIVVTVEQGDRFATRVGPRLAPPGVDMGRLIALRAAIADIVPGTSPAAFDASLDRVDHSPRYPGWLVVLGMATTAAALARLFGATWTVVAASFVAGLVNLLLRTRLGKYGMNGIAVAAITAFVSGVAGVLVLKPFPGVSPVLCLTAAGMILVPGVPLINGVRDLVTGHAANGISRLATGVAMLMAIGLALLAAAASTGGTLPVDASPVALGLAEDVAFAGVAAFGFALLFNVPTNDLWICVVCGMASHGLRTALQHAGLDLAAASLAGTLAAGAIARVATRRIAAPAVAFAFAGTVALIPGSYGFRTAVGAIEIMQAGGAATPGLLATTVSLAITTLVVTLAIATGLCLALAGESAHRHGRTPSLP